MHPAEHKVLVLESYGSPMVVHSKPVPTPGPGQLLVRVEATGLNPADWKIRKRGVSWFKVPGPLGFEGAGVVEQVGDGVERVVSGDKMLVRSTSSSHNLPNLLFYQIVPMHYSSSSIYIPAIRHRPLRLCC
jgi:NADPH:quinone reductase-like Zn-dependent oxidoreductase